MNPTTTTSTQNDDVTHDFPPFFKVYKDGRVEKYMLPQFIPPGAHPATGVVSKDVVISAEPRVSARIFLPPTDAPAQKLPLLIHYHGGGFCGGSPFDQITLTFCSELAAAAKAVVLSVDYRLAPENPLPAAYDDSWAALQWAAAHAHGTGPEPWLNEHVDFRRLFLGGESAGANIAHDVAVRAGDVGLPGRVKVVGLMAVHPFFGGEEPDEMYRFLCPTSSGSGDDPRLNPRVDERVRKLGCDSVLVCLAEKDGLKERGRGYYEWLTRCGWGGTAELVETDGEDHCFHLFNLGSEKREPFIRKLASFVNREG